MYDVIIIGAGVAGAASARELSRYQAKICVLEKEEDVCCGTSKANSAIVHAGYDAAEGSLMAKLNVRGNEMMEQLSKDLDFPFKRNGSLAAEAELRGAQERIDAQAAVDQANADLAEAQSALEQAQTALDADSENADLLAARDAAQARVDELNQTIAEKQAILDAAPAETPAPEAPAEEEQPAE